MTRTAYWAHPSVGLKPLGKKLQMVFPTALDELPAAWRDLSENEQDMREVQFFRQLLGIFANQTGAVVTFDIPSSEELRRLRSVDPSITIDPHQCQLSRLIATEMPLINPIILEVKLAGELVMLLHDGWTGVTANLTDAEAATIRAPESI